MIPLLPKFCDIYDDFKTKQKDALLIGSYYQFLFITLLEMFDYKNLPETMNKRYIENALLHTGFCFVWRNKAGDLISSMGTLGGPPDAYGLGTKCLATTLNGETKEGARDVDIVCGFNNDFFSNENDFLIWCSHILSEIDISTDINVKYSRILPAPIVKDEKTKRAFEEYILKILKGDMTAVLSDNVLNNLNDINVNVINITDPKNIENVQHLSRLHDDILKQFYNRYGQALQTQNKAAQTNTDELHGMDSVSFILPINMLKCRQIFIEKINDVFGTNITVDFSDAWRHEYQNYLNRTAGAGEESLETLEPSEPTELTESPEQPEPDTVTGADVEDVENVENVDSVEEKTVEIVINMEDTPEESQEKPQEGKEELKDDDET